MAMVCFTMFPWTDDVYCVYWVEAEDGFNSRLGHQQRLPSRTAKVAILSSINKTSQESRVQSIQVDQNGDTHSLADSPRGCVDRPKITCIVLSPLHSFNHPIVPYTHLHQSFDRLQGSDSFSTFLHYTSFQAS